MLDWYLTVESGLVFLLVLAVRSTRNQFRHSSSAVNFASS